MNSTILAAIIGVVGGAVVKPVVEYVLGVLKAKSAKIPSLVGKWRGNWYIEGIPEIYSDDTIHIEKQHGFDIFGKGSDRWGIYVLKGEISLGGIVCLSFHYEGHGNLAVGVVIVRINTLKNKCEGYWQGYTHEEQIQGGKVIWTKI